MWANLRAYADTGAAVLTITHDGALLAETEVADAMVFMRDGRTIAAGSLAEIRALADPYVQGFSSDRAQLSLVRSTFPVALRGSSSRNSTSRGTL